MAAVEGNAAEMIINGYNVTCESATKCTALSKSNEGSSSISANQVGITYNGSNTTLNRALDDLYDRIGN